MHSSSHNCDYVWHTKFPDDVWHIIYPNGKVCLKPVGKGDHKALASQETAVTLMHTAHDSTINRCLGFQSDPSHHSSLSGMSAAKAHNFFCESLCFLKMATLDGSLYKAAFTCSQQRPGISLTTIAHRFCCLNAVKARHNVMQVQVRSMTTSDTGMSPGSASQHILGDILLDPTMQATRQQD